MIADEKRGLITGSECMSGYEQTRQFGSVESAWRPESYGQPFTGIFWRTSLFVLG